jgi:hypothetical protein
MGTKNRRQSLAILSSFSGAGSSILMIVPRLPSDTTTSIGAYTKPFHWSDEPGPKNPVAAYTLRNGMLKDNRVKARMNWKFAIHSVRKIWRATMIFKPAKVDTRKIRIINSPTFPVSNLGFLLKSFQSKVRPTDVIITLKGRRCTEYKNSDAFEPATSRAHRSPDSRSSAPAIQ